MSETKHTPGPWTYERQDSEEGPIYFAVHGKGYEFITNVEENPLNARLISAAPELLAVLKELVNSFDHADRTLLDSRHMETLVRNFAEVARAAIAKAEGHNE